VKPVKAHNGFQNRVPRLPKLHLQIHGQSTSKLSPKIRQAVQGGPKPIPIPWLSPQGNTSQEHLMVAVDIAKKS
jgi:hypothetical protein